MTTRLICGDSLEVLRTLPSESVQCCITSPPYWGLRDYGVEGQLGLEPTPDCGRHGLVRIKIDLSPDQLEYVARRLRDEGLLDE